MVLMFLGIFLTLAYCALLFYFILGAQRLYRKTPLEISEMLPSLSVVVPVKNEAGTIKTLLEALSRQDYRGEWEVICVNDQSTDETGDILSQFCGKKKNFIVIDIPCNAKKTVSPKKRALQAGFNKAKGSVLMTTDADCLPPRGWLRSMARNFTPSIGIVQGPKRIIGPGNLITRYQAVEVFGYVSIEAATFAMGKPMLASAPSLAYRKSLYNEVQGFKGLEHLVSGDDDMLVQKMTQREEGNVRYNLDREACVATSPAQTWKEVLQQRARWASNGTKYQDKKFVSLLICIFVFYLWIFCSPFAVFAGIIPWYGLIVPLGLKTCLDMLFLTHTASKLKQKRLLIHIWWAEFMHIPITIAAVIMGHFKLYRWK